MSNGYHPYLAFRTDTRGRFALNVMGTAFLTFIVERLALSVRHVALNTTAGMRIDCLTEATRLRSLHIQILPNGWVTGGWPKGVVLPRLREIQWTVRRAPFAIVFPQNGQQYTADTKRSIYQLITAHRKQPRVLKIGAGHI